MPSRTRTGSAIRRTSPGRHFSHGEKARSTAATRRCWPPDMPGPRVPAALRRRQRCRKRAPRPAVFPAQSGRRREPTTPPRYNKAAAVAVAPKRHRGGEPRPMTADLTIARSPPRAERRRAAGLEHPLVRAATSEFIATAFLLIAVVGSGIMAERLGGGNAGLALLANALATG